MLVHRKMRYVRAGSMSSGFEPIIGKTMISTIINTVSTRGDDEREPRALPENAARAKPVSGAECLRDEWIDAEDDAHSEDRESEEERVRESRAGELTRAETAEHRDVDETHELRARLRCRERQREPEKTSQLGFIAFFAHEGRRF